MIPGHIWLIICVITILGIDVCPKIRGIVAAVAVASLLTAIFTWTGVGTGIAYYLIMQTACFIVITLAAHLLLKKAVLRYFSGDWVS